MKKTRLYLSDIEKAHPQKEYKELYEYICSLIENGCIAPVKNSITNGMKPALPLTFWKFEDEKDYSKVFEELDFNMHPLINTEYYRNHPDKYEEDADNIQKLNNYLKYNSELLSVKETMNERSFEIFKREKFFQKENGIKFCEKLGIDAVKLNYYETSEPLSYYSHSKKYSQNILIIENKDTFYDIRKCIQNTDSDVLGVYFDTVIYGAGKGIWKSFEDYAKGAEEYFAADNELYYFGDLDYEGILIYEHLIKDKWKNTADREIKIKPFAAAYEAMLDKAEKLGMDNMPYTKEKQNNNIDNIFLDYFENVRKTQILDILEKGRYIPQEILNEHDWSVK